jgi:hypothetical protein
MTLELFFFEKPINLRISQLKKKKRESKRNREKN